MSYLEDKMKSLLAEASVLANASGMELQPRTSKGKNESKPPSRFGRSLHEVIREDFSAAESDSERRSAIRRAEGLIQGFKRQRPRGEMESTERDFWKHREVLNYEGKHYEDVAYKLKVSAKTVWKVRSRNNLDPRYGRPKEGKRDEAA